MKNETTFTFRTDKNLRDQATIAANAIGIPLSTIINAFLREFVSSGKVQFSATKRPPAQFKKVISAVKAEMPIREPKNTPVGPLTHEQAIAYAKALLGDDFEID